MIGSFKETQEHTEGVVLWSGSLTDIPEHWALCDGNNGTPDLTDQFIKGTGGEFESPGSTGGQDSVTLSKSQLPSHTHSGSTDTLGEHAHSGDYDYNTAYWVNGGSANTNSNLDQDGSYVDSDSIDNVSKHRHSMSVSSTGGSGAYDNRPAFFEVAYIMRI